MSSAGKGQREKKHGFFLCTFAPCSCSLSSVQAAIAGVPSLDHVNKSSQSLLYYIFVLSRVCQFNTDLHHWEEGTLN